MSGPDRPDEFEQIARLFRPLTRGAPEALDLLDDAAVIPSRPGFDLVVTKDAMVEGVHFLSGEDLETVARRLLRVNLSDLAAKGAEPYGYFLAVAWRRDCGWLDREAFARGLDLDGRAYGLVLLGGDSVSTDGPLTVSATLLGWAPHGGMIRRGGARAGDLLLTSGPIGQGVLGLMAARGEIPDPEGALSRHFRLPEPRLDLREALRRHASACADVSDGLIADAGHLARASRLSVEIELDQLPLSDVARNWLAAQVDRSDALRRLASGGDDYELVIAAAPGAAATLGLPVIGRFMPGEGIGVTVDGQPLAAGPGGWRHG